MGELRRNFSGKSFPGQEKVLQFVDLCEEIGKTVTLQKVFNPELFPNNGSLRGLKRLTAEQRTKMFVDLITRCWYEQQPDRHKVDMLLKAGVDVECALPPFVEGDTLLGFSARRGFLHCVEALLRHGANPGAKTEKSLTPFQQAAYWGQVEVMKFLAAQGADLSQRTDYGMTPLMLVVNGAGRRDGCTQAIEFLLAHGASLDDKDNGGRTVMDIYRYNHLGHQSAGWTSDWAKPLLDASAALEARRRKEEATAKLLKKMGQVGTQAGGGPSAAALKHYIDEGADIEARDSFWKTTPLGIFAHYNDIAQVRVLVAAGAEVSPRDSKQGATPFIAAGSNGYMDLMGLLLEHGADVNEADNSGATALIHATRWGCRLEAVKFMIAQGAEVDTVDSAGKTAFDYCEEGKKDARYYRPRGHGDDVYTELEQVLLAGSHRRLLEKKTGGDYKASDWTLVRRLIDSGADVNEKDAHGWTPFLWAASRGDVSVMQLLLDHGADRHATDNQGKNALMLAAYPEPRIEAAGFLLDAGVYADVKDARQRTAADWLEKVLTDEKGRVGDAPKAQVLGAFKRSFDEGLGRQLIAQYGTGLRSTVALSGSLRLKKPASAP